MNGTELCAELLAEVNRRIDSRAAGVGGSGPCEVAADRGYIDGLCRAVAIVTGGVLDLRAQPSGGTFKLVQR